jgi:hypothetical protein
MNSFYGTFTFMEHLQLGREIFKMYGTFAINTTLTLLICCHFGKIHCNMYLEITKMKNTTNLHTT